VRAALTLSLVAIALGGCGGDGGGDGKAPGRDGKPGTEETRGGTELVAFPAGDNIVDLLAGPGGVWVAYTGEDYVSRIDPRSNTISRFARAPGEARALATDGRSVWVLGEVLDEERQRYFYELTQIAPDPDANPVRVGRAAEDATFAAGLFWVSLESPRGVQGFHPLNLQSEARVLTQGEPWGLAAADGLVWAVDNSAGSVLRIDAQSGERIGDPIPVGESPFDVAVAAGAAWIPLENVLARIDAETGELRRIPMPGMYDLDEIAAGAGSLWVAQGGRPAKLQEIDPRTGRRVGKPRPIARGHSGVNALDVGEDAVWVALNDGAPATPDEVVRVEP
jgi:streptogramin lyase